MLFGCSENRNKMSEAKVLIQLTFLSRAVLKQKEHQHVKAAGKTAYKQCMAACPQ